MHKYCRYDMSSMDKKNKKKVSKVNEHINFPPINSVEGILGKRGDSIAHEHTSVPKIKRIHSQVLTNTSVENH